MKALVKVKPGVGHVELIDVEEPQCKEAQSVKIEVKYTGICGTDLHVYHDTFRNYPPVIMGHEFSGTVVNIGDQVKDVHIGDRVTVLPSSAIVCGKCEHCRQGNYMFCPIRRGMGHGVHGSFTRYVVVREDQVYPIPDDVSFEEAALSEPYACAVQAIDELTAFQVGDTVLLSGPGPIGLLCLLEILAKGCRVIVAGTKQDALRLELAKRMGADIAVDVTSEDLQAIVARETGGRGADIAVECSGAEASIAACLQAVKKLGKYVQVGIVGRNVNIAFDTFLYKQIQMYGSLGHSLTSWEGVMRVLRQRKLNLTQVITHKLPLSRWREAFDLCESKQGAKVLISYDE